MTGAPIPVAATGSPKMALTRVDFPTPVLPKMARLIRPSCSACLSNSARKVSVNHCVTPASLGGTRPPGVTTCPDHTRPRPRAGQAGNSGAACLISAPGGITRTGSPTSTAWIASVLTCRKLRPSGPKVSGSK